jgi:O-antigen ligase
MTVLRKLEGASFLGLWLLAAVTLLSIAAQNIVFVGMAAWLAWRLGSGQGLPSVPRPLLWALPFLAWTLLASWMGENRGHSLETWRRWLIIFVTIYAADALSEERPLRAVLGSLLLFSGLWALGASLLALGGPLGAWSQGVPWDQVLARWSSEGAWRAVSGSGGFMVLGTGSMLLLCLFAGLWLEDAAWRKSLPVLAMAALALALLLTQTRSAWLGAAAGLGCLALFRRPRWALSALVGLLLLGALWPSNPVSQRLRQGVDMRHESTRERVFMLRGARELMAQKPWLGHGDSLASWQAADGPRQGAYVRTQAPHAGTWGFPLDREHGHLHNNINQVAVMYGIPAAFLLLLLAAHLALSAWRLRGSKQPLVRGLALGMLAAWVAWWVNGLFEFNFGSTQSGFTLWLLWGLAFAGFRLERA